MRIMSLQKDYIVRYAFHAHELINKEWNVL